MLPLLCDGISSHGEPLAVLKLVSVFLRLPSAAEVAHSARHMQTMAATSHTFAEIRNQVLATFVVNTLVFGFGCSIGWYSPALPYLQSERTPLADGPLSAEAAGWIGAFLPFGAIFGMSFGFLANWAGVKKALLLNVVPLIVSLVGLRCWQRLAVLHMQLFELLKNYSKLFHLYGQLSSSSSLRC